MTARTELRPALRGTGALDRAKAAVLILHGGQENSLRPAAARQLAVVRMSPIAWHLTAAGSAAGLAVWRLLFRYRGWNQGIAHPVEDVRWAMSQLRARHGDVPVVLVGHSMGGRAAFAAADEAGVVGVLGLAPWLPPAEPREHCAGRQVLVVHGMHDRITSSAASREFVREVRPIASAAGFIGLRRAGHPMVRRFALWHRLSTEFVLRAGLGLESTGGDDGPIGRALAGDNVVM